MTLNQAVSIFAAVTLGGIACGKGDSKRQPPKPAAPCRCGADAGGFLSAPNPDAGVAPTRPGPVRRVQHFTLAAAAKGYRNHQRCVRSVHAVLPPELTREADPTNLAERICQTRRALAEKRPALCEEIDDPFWPRACRRLYGALHGKPRECPPRARRFRGRDGLCVALASRDPALCRAVRSAGGRQRCAAILGSQSFCRGMRTTAELASCQLDRKRWRAVLRPGKPSLEPKYAPRYELTLKGPKDTLRGISAALDRGVVVPAAGSRGRFLLGGLRPLGRPSAPEGRLLLLADLPPPGKLPASLAVGTAKAGARFCALWKGRPVRPGQIRGEVKITGYGTRRGARVVGSFNLKVTHADGAVAVKGTFDTFVRDVVPGAWARVTCAERLAELAPTQTARKVTPAPADSAERPCYFVAHWQGLRQLGYRVYGVRPRAACARLGLRNGDVVLAAGNRPGQRPRPLARWADVVSLYGQLAAPGPLMVRLLRKGKKRTLKRAGR